MKQAPKNWLVKCPYAQHTNKKWRSIIAYVNTVGRINLGGNDENSYYGLNEHNSAICTGYIRENFQEMSIDEAYEAFIEPKKEIPTSWAVLRPEDWDVNKKWKELVQYQNSITGKSFKGKDARTYYGINEDGTYICSLKPYHDVTIFSIDEAHDLFIKQTNTPEMKKTLILRPEFLAEAYERADDDVKALIRRYVDAWTRETTETFVLQMKERFSGCPEWTRKLKEEFPKIQKEEVIDTSNNTYKGVPVFMTYGTDAMIATRVGSNYDGKAFLLNENYDWNIVRDDTDHMVLSFKLKEGKW